MTLKEVLERYTKLKEQTQETGQWEKIDELFKEMALLAIGLPEEEPKYVYNYFYMGRL